jgi:hypothetical protein
MKLVFPMHATTKLAVDSYLLTLRYDDNSNNLAEGPEGLEFRELQFDPGRVLAFYDFVDLRNSYSRRVFHQAI